MADLSTDFCGIKSPNPFWLASAPPTNSGDQVMRAFDCGWGGAVWKTLGDRRLLGLNNIELITDRTLDTNLREIREVKRRYPNHALLVSLMVESKDDWKEIIRRVEDTGCDGLELNFGCPHGMCERGMGSAVGQEPKVITEITSWAKEYAKTPVVIKLTPNVSDIRVPAVAAVRGGCDGLSLINTIKSIVGVDLDRMVPLPAVGMQSTNGGYCGPAVKPIALHMVGALARDARVTVPISGIGGISNWRDAAEFLALGSTSVQVCTAVMHRGYRIVEEMIEGLSDFLDEKGWGSVRELHRKAVGAFVEFGELDLNYRVKARIDAGKCIGCDACYVSCMDGAHQAIHRPWETPVDGNEAPSFAAVHAAWQKDKGYRVPWVDETECVGCNLCALVCPVEGCITMENVNPGEKAESWNERVAAGRGVVPGGLHS